jgi:hypothetical protein
VKQHPDQRDALLLVEGERADGDVGPVRQERHRPAFGQPNTALSPNPQPGQGTEKRALAASGRAHDQQPLSRSHLQGCLRQENLAIGREHPQTDERQLAFGMVRIGNQIRAAFQVLQVNQSVPVGDGPMQRYPPLRERGEPVHEPAQRLLNLRECAGDHHQATEGQTALEITGCRHDDGSDDRHPAIAGRDPGQPREAAGDLAHDGESLAGRLSKPAPFILLAAVNGDSFSGIVDTDEKEAEFGLPGAQVSIGLNQRLADQPGQ